MRSLVPVVLVLSGCGIGVVRVQGRVGDGPGAAAPPLADARIEILDEDSFPFDATTSDAEGEFAVEAPPDGGLDPEHREEIRRRVADGRFLRLAVARQVHGAELGEGRDVLEDRAAVPPVRVVGRAHHVVAPPGARLPDHRQAVRKHLA